MTGAKIVRQCTTTEYTRGVAEDPRQPVQVRLRQSSLTEVDAIAAEHDWDRSTALRTLLALGLKAWKEGKR